MNAAGILRQAAQVLVVEDSRTQAMQLAETLREVGYDVLMATDGRQALSLMLSQRPNIVISDIVMPAMDGYELTRRIRSDPYLRDLPVILVTSMSDPQDVIRGLECGADGFVLKPFDVRYLVGRIQFILLNRQLGRDADAELGVRIHFNGQQHFITADRLQILSLLLSTYEAAIQRNHSLADSQDALERKTTELQSANLFLDSVIENMPSGIFVLDAADRRIVRVNRAGEQLIGTSRELLIGQSGAQYFSADEVALIEAGHRRALTEQVVFDEPQFELHALDGVVRTLHVRRVPVVDGDGRATHLILMCDDITARARAEARLIALNAELTQKSQELLTAQRAAEAANRAKSDFLAAVSHEIRTPLNGVIGMVDVLHQSSLLDHQVELVDLIRESAQSLLGIIEDILDFSKIEAGKMTVERVPIDVGDIVDRACGLVDNLAVQKEVELTVYVDPALPRLVLGDALRLRQVLLNLIGNAIKFSSGRPDVRGRVTVRASIADEPCAEPGHRVLLLQIRDNGIGIDKAALSRLFLEFEQADQSTTRRFGGTGLGLAISSRLIRLMDGKVSVRSALGEGAEFSVTLPVEIVEPAPAAPPADQAGRLLDGLRCIVVGERDGLAEDHAAYLGHAGAVVARAPDLAAAWRWTESQDGGLLVWVLDLEGFIPSTDLRTSLEQGGGEHEVRIVVVAIGRGRRRQSRTIEAGVTMLDGNVLVRRRFVEAVAMAAGRLVAPVRAATEGRAVPDATAAGRERRAAVAAAPATVATEAAEAAGRVAPLPPPAADRILVVEDNETNRKVISRQLDLLNYPVDIVGDGEEALECWRSGRYALILTDLQMPRRDGRELAAAVRALEQERGVAAGVPIVALSANAGQEEVARCKAAGMDDYLSKPVQIARLSAMLERWLPKVDVDLDVLASFVGSDPEVIADLVETFRTAAARMAMDLLAACRQGDGAAAAAVAHKFKAACRTVGAYPTADICETIESEARAGAGERFQEAARLFEWRFARLQARLDGWQVPRSAPGATESASSCDAKPEAGT
ncbi:MAG: response regulator [Lautropia sp.]